ncbi:MAG: type II secretion system protein M [Burkholderiales bacterium]|jgi:type II secretory pathway component PulM|nr:type II secretion system protein M [Burkholderiales bacterium]
MNAKLSKQIERLKDLIGPKLELLKIKWLQLQPREQQLVGVMGIFVTALLLFMMISGLINFNRNLSQHVNNLFKFSIYSKQAANTYKSLNKIEANSFNQANLEQVKGDVSQVLQIKDPDILIQDGQMTVNVPNAEFTQVMALMEQFRRSYGIFPSQVHIVRQTRTGFVSFNATFWIKQ